MTTTSSRVHVALAKNSYDIHIGHDLFTAAADDLSILLAEKQVVIITDANIAPLHLQATERHWLNLPAKLSVLFCQLAKPVSHSAPMSSS